MRYVAAVRPSWVALHLAPFTLRAGREPTDRDLEEDAALEHPLAVDVPHPFTISVDWSTGSVEVAVLRPDCDDADDLGDALHVCARAHPLHLRSAVSRSMQADAARIVAALVDDFWFALTRRHEALIAAGTLVVHARGGPKPVDGFRRMPPDVWAASTVDWAAGTCVTPDGHVYYSIHVALTEPSAARSGDGEDVGPIRAEPAGAARRSTGGTEGMDVHAASRLLGVSKSSLDKWRLNGSGPPFHRIGSRVRYLEPDLEAWRNRRRSPGQPS